MELSEYLQKIIRITYLRSEKIYWRVDRSHIAWVGDVKDTCVKRVTNLTLNPKTCIVNAFRIKKQNSIVQSLRRCHYE